MICRKRIVMLLRLRKRKTPTLELVEETTLRRRRKMKRRKGEARNKMVLYKRRGARKNLTKRMKI
jgi:hypothetical protein